MQGYDIPDFVWCTLQYGQAKLTTPIFLEYSIKH